jgi:acyl carrier protein
MSTFTKATIVKLLTELGTIESGYDFDENVALDKQGVDSLDKMNLFVSIEEEYNISVPDEDFERLSTINDMVDYLNEKRK